MIARPLGLHYESMRPLAVRENAHNWYILNKFCIQHVQRQFNIILPLACVTAFLMPEGLWSIILADLVCLVNEPHHAREPLYSNSAVIARWLQSTSAQNNVPNC